MATWAESLEGSFTWKIKEFSKLSDEVKYSEPFEIGGYKWRLWMYPKGDGQENKDHLSLYLKVADADALPKGWTRTASFTVIVHHQSDPEKSVRNESSKNRLFNTDTNAWGRSKFMKLDELNDAQKGFLVDDSITVEVKVKVKQEILQVFTKNDKVRSLCLQFDGFLKEPKSDSNQEDWVSLKEDAKHKNKLCFYLDAGFMSIHSKLVENMIDDMNLSAANESDKPSQIVIPVPTEFCPGRCSLEDVQRALGHLYLPQEFSLQQCNSSMHKLLQVADYFQMKYLTSDIESHLLNQIEKKLKANSTVDVNPFMEWMLWSDSFDLKRCWSALKEGLFPTNNRSYDKLLNILSHKDFEKLSLQYQIDFTKSACTTLVPSVHSLALEKRVKDEVYAHLDQQTTIRCPSCYNEKRANIMKCCRDYRWK